MLISNCRLAPTVDVVLLSHGDLLHSGLYAYAYSRWGLKAPAYTSLPVQAMARIAVTEDVEGLRDEQEVDASVAEHSPEQDSMEVAEEEQSEKVDDTENPVLTDEALDSNSMDVDQAPSLPDKKGRYIATAQEVHDAFDSVNVLRYQQPCHLGGRVYHPLSYESEPLTFRH
jgi:cleavage and polyadenylation specificity factor subunit 2